MRVPWPSRIVALAFVAVLLACGCRRENVAPLQTDDDVDEAFAISVQHIEPLDRRVDLPAPERASPDQPAAADDQDASAAGPLIDNVFRMAGKMPMVWRVTEWANSEPIRWPDLRGRVVVVRFFKLDCEACQRTMPAMQRLYEEFRDCPVLFIGLFHSGNHECGPEWDVVMDQVRAWGVTFPIARDEGGVTLSRWWLDYFEYVPDTPTFVIGPDGRIVYVQPGPEFHPNDDLMFALCDRDYETIRLAIQTALPRDVAHRRRMGQ
jgi:thiol-disulfide isomerase/thioredoxin